MIALFLRDLKLSLRAGGGALIGVLFFLTVVAVIPFGVGPDMALLARIGPAIVWIGALLAALLGLDRLFQADRDDGALDPLLMQETPLVLTILVKCLAHWTATCLPLVMASPLLGLFMNMSEKAIGAVMLTLFVGSPAIAFIGAAGAAVAVVLPRGGLLVSILVLPMTIPVLIFGVSASYAAVSGPGSFLTPFFYLVALTLFFAVIGPLAAAMALRNSSD
ncbi:heme exporter protein CcmB [Allorhizobium sp. BGMRC 0089]|uniref:heme exporter protein CcmB n=1 Tax=Allorhizobium sonneratiae TaxID=2934936 RepID=UPI00203440C2|nr:heme exporter protein CcmB [Allorhizobium sonneratiae]MCM2293363.1 heme exporter protein CcmB [Allorhizobium sonneratiae]